MMWYALCLFIGAGIGFMAAGFMRGSSHDADCKECKAYYAGIIRERDAVIHGLKITKGALAKELQDMSFGRYGAKAR
jgi:hypothetical protein